MKKIALILCLVGSACFGQTSSVTINANGQILNSQTVNFATGKLTVNGVAVTGGGVTTVTGTAPIVSSGGTTPAISITAATTGAPGSMSAADKTKLDAISGTNTGDQTSIVGITGTLAQFNTALTGADFATGGGTATGTNTGDQDLSALALKATTISTTSPLAGGGDLSSNRTFSIADAAADGSTKGAASFTAADFNATAGLVSIDYTNGQAASGSVKGFLTSADWTTFNGKLSGNQTITLSGNVTGSGATSITTTIANDAVTYAKMQNVSATSRVLGRKTAGAGDVEELTFSEVLDFVSSAAQGDILYRNATAWVRLAAGTDGDVLTTHGASANPTWETPSGGASYLVYTALLTQSGTDAPVATVLQNTTGVTITWNYADVGKYHAVPSVNFADLDKIGVRIGLGTDLSAGSQAWFRKSGSATDHLQIWSADAAGIPSDAIFSGTLIDIIVAP